MVCISVKWEELKLAELRKEISKRGLTVVGDKRYKSTLLFALGVKGYYSVDTKTKTLDIFDNWSAAWDCETEKEAASYLKKLKDEEVLKGFVRVLKENNLEKLKKVFHVLLLNKDYLLEELFDLVLEYKPKKFGIKEMKKACIEVMEKDEEEQLSAYELLDVSYNVSTKELKETYRGLVRIYHPDMPGGDAFMFNQINEAYNEILVDIGLSKKKKKK